MDFGKLLNLIQDSWELFEAYLLPRNVWIGRSEELRSIRNSIAHVRRPNADYLSRVELTLRDLEPGFREALRSMVADYDLGDRVSDPIVSSFRSGRLKFHADALRRKYRVDVDLGVSGVRPGIVPSAPQAIARAPHLLWHLNIGGPEYWIVPEVFYLHLPELARKHLVFALMPAPSGGIFTFPAVDDASAVENALEGVMVAIGASFVRMDRFTDPDNWPSGRAQELDQRLLVGTSHLFAYADNPDEPGTIFHA